MRIEGESPPLCKGTYGLRCAPLRASKDGGGTIGAVALRGSLRSHLRVTVIELRQIETKISEEKK